MKHTDSADAQGSTGYIEAPVSALRPGPFQTRSQFDISELTDSIKESGVVQPIVVRGGPDSYEILAGERRWRAAKAAGVATVRVIVRNDLDELGAAIITTIENVQREQLNPVDKARAYKVLSDFGLTHAQIAERVGKSRVEVTNSLRLLKLDSAVLVCLSEGDIEEGHARLLIGMNPQLQIDYSRRIVHHGWNVRQLEASIKSFKSLLKGPTVAAQSGNTEQEGGADLKRLAETLSQAIGFPVSIDYRDGKGGEIRIRYFTVDDAEAIAERMQGGDDSAGRSS